MALLTPTTELEAVNTLLESIEEEAVNTLSGNQDPDVTAALRFIRQSSRALQVTGWVFNTETGYTLFPDVTGKIAVPRNAVKATLPGSDVAIRGGLLYDRANRTYTWTGPVDLELILLLPFEELPEAARSYVVADASFKLQAKRAPDELVARLTQRDVQAAWNEFVADDTRSGNFTFNHINAIQTRTR